MSDKTLVRSCATCQFVQRKLQPPNIEAVLSCHRMPPSAGVMLTNAGPQQFSAFPIVQPGMYCYEYVPEGELIDRARNPNSSPMPPESKLIVS